VNFVSIKAGSHYVRANLLGNSKWHEKYRTVWKQTNCNDRVFKTNWKNARLIPYNGSGFITNFRCCISELERCKIAWARRLFLQFGKNTQVSSLLFKIYILHCLFCGIKSIGEKSKCFFRNTIDISCEKFWFQGLRKHWSSRNINLFADFDWQDENRPSEHFCIQPKMYQDLFKPDLNSVANKVECDFDAPMCMG